MVWIGIYWSDGCVVEDIADEKIYDKDITKTLTQLKNIFESNGEKATDLFLNILLQLGE